MNIIITLPSMGKTTLVKKGRDNAWRKALGVDIDMRGLNSYTDSDRIAITQMVNGFQDRYSFCTTFNGAICPATLRSDADMYFVVPDDYAVCHAVARAIFRGDSSTFVGFYNDHRNEWCNGLIESFITASILRRKRKGHVYMVVVKSTHVLTDYFHDNGDFKNSMLPYRFELSKEWFEERGDRVLRDAKHMHSAICSIRYFNYMDLNPEYTIWNAIEMQITDGLRGCELEDVYEIMYRIGECKNAKHYKIIADEAFMQCSCFDYTIAPNEIAFWHKLADLISDGWVVDKASDCVISLWKCSPDEDNPAYHHRYLLIV